MQGKAGLVGENHFPAGEIAGSPEVPAGDGAPGPPLFGAAQHGVWFGEHGGVEGFALRQTVEGEGETFADAVIGDGEDVGAAEAKDEEHLDGPRADAANCGETLDDFRVGHAADGDEGGNGAVEGLRGEIAEGFGLGGGEAAGAEHVVGRLKQVFRSGMELAERGEQAFENGRGRLAVELLINDGFEQRLKGRVLAFELQGEGSGALDEVAEFRVGGGEVAAGLLSVVADGASSVGHGEDRVQRIAESGQDASGVAGLRTQDAHT